ncbi:hypothetical protein SBBP2_700016 [Burkholderiales bacterium]|nr:hypothetical protein SBBP2_700016 [Burkholderiales bacterium]
MQHAQLTSHQIPISGKVSGSYSGSNWHADYIAEHLDCAKRSEASALQRKAPDGPLAKR